MTDYAGKVLDEPSIPNKYIRCPECGEQILMVPVLDEMIKTIENHLETHNEPQQNPMGAPKIPLIETDLTVQVLQRAAEISGALNKNSTWVNLE